jgi:hypothetical protein
VRPGSTVAICVALAVHPLNISLDLGSDSSMLTTFEGTTKSETRIL